MTARPPEGIDPIPLDRIRMAGGDALTEKIVDLFLEHGPARLAVAREAVAKGDADALERCTHSLKSSAAQVGAERLAGICRELEARARRNEFDGAEELVASADEAMGVFAGWVKGQH